MEGMLDESLRLDMSMLMPGQRVLQLLSLSSPASQQSHQKDQSVPGERSGNGDFKIGRVITPKQTSKK